MRLKIRDSHLTCKVSNKYLNVCESVYVVEWNKRWSLPFPCCPVNRQCLWRKPWWKKNLKERFFQEFFSINKTFIFSRRLETRLYFYKVLTVSWYFLISSDPKSYLVRKLLKWKIYNMFIGNNRTSFHLWKKENLIKHWNVLKY